MKKLTEEERAVRKEEIRAYNKEYFRIKTEDPEFVARRKLVAAKYRAKKKLEKEKLAMYEKKYGEINL